MTNDKEEPDRKYRVLARIETLGYLDITCGSPRAALRRANSALTGAAQPELMLTGREGASRVMTDREHVYALPEPDESPETQLDADYENFGEKEAS